MGQLASRVADVLPERFPDRGLVIDRNRFDFALFPHAHVEVGDIELCDGGHEIIACVGDILHIHLGDVDDGPDREDPALQDVLGFLGATFEERIEFFKTRLRGGCGRRGSGFGDVFVWSGPVSKSLKWPWLRWTIGNIILR